MNRLTRLRSNAPLSRAAGGASTPMPSVTFSVRCAEQLEGEARTRGEFARTDRAAHPGDRGVPTACRSRERGLGGGAAYRRSNHRARRDRGQRNRRGRRSTGRPGRGRRGKACRKHRVVIGQLRTRRRAARADLKRLVEVLAGSVRDDEARRAARERRAHREFPASSADRCKGER